MKKIMPMAGLALLAACTTPADVSKPLSAGGDKNAKFDIKDSATGFTVDLRYSRYQFIPEADALMAACRSIATTRTYEEAKRRGKEIQPINEQTLRLSTGRNIINARTSCRAFVEAVWKEG
ncbi:MULTISPECIES: hypothetical protein [Sphingobium]|uniref:hypothetical protein n=1 Tax=Sphingobium TaxID=165695 RepID=UPI000E710402|nr:MULTISPECIES: hypothetical protein [Sphingobium]KAA9016065.1 hypothetical protein F4U94_10405 [Sphingobium limneticum]